MFVAAATRLHDEGIPLLMVGGNHDATSELVRRMRLPESAHVFRTDVATTYRVPGLDLAVHGQGFATQAVTANLARAYPDADPGLVNVGLLHANVGASSGHNNYAPCTEDDLVRLGYDYMALGHIHARRTFEHDGRVVAAYAGNPQGRSARELEAKGANPVTLAPGAVPVLDFRALDVLRWHTIDVDTEGLDAVDVPPESGSVDVQASWRLASGDGGARTVLGATLAQTAWMIGAKIGTAMPPPVEPPPSVRRLPSALS